MKLLLRLLSEPTDAVYWSQILVLKEA